MMRLLLLFVLVCHETVGFVLLKTHTFLQTPNDASVDCSKLPDCGKTFYTSVGLKNPDGSLPSNATELDIAIAQLFDDKGKEGFIDFCSAATKTLLSSTCFDSPKALDSCITVGQLLNNGKSLEEAKSYVEIYRQMRYRCGVAYQTTLSSWECTRHRAKAAAGDIEQCDNLYRSQLGLDPTKACKYSQSYASCTSSVFDSCGQSAVLAMCGQIQTMVSVQVPGCSIKCNGDGYLPTPVPVTGPTTKNPLSVAYYRGSFVDMSTVWKPQFAHPDTGILNGYIDQLVWSLSAFDAPKVTIIRLTHSPLNVMLREKVNYVKVMFMLQLATVDGAYLMASTVQTKMQAQADKRKFKWQSLELESLFNPATTPDPGVSNSVGWERASRFLHEAMDETANPCENFYEFACGNWIKNHPIPSYLPIFDVYMDLTLEVMYNVTDLFLKLQPKNSIRAIQQAKIFFDSCMSGATTGNDTGYILQLLADYGKWPILEDNWSGPVGGASLGDASALIGRLLGTIGVETLVGVQPIPNWESPKENVVIVYPPDPKFKSNTPVESIRDEIVSLAKVLVQAAGKPVDEEKLKAEATPIAELESKLAQLPTYVPFPFPSYNVFDLTKAQSRWKYLNWHDAFVWFAKDNVDQNVMLEQKFAVGLLEYFDKLGDVLKDVPDKTMQNFLLWRLVMLQAKTLPQFREHREILYKLQKGTQEAAPIELHCSNALIQNLPWVTGRVYVDDWIKQSPANTIGSLHDMVTNVLTSFQGMLHDLSWIDATSKAAAYEKVHNLVKNVAYPSFLLNDEKLNAKVSVLKLNKDDDTFVMANKVLRYKTWSMMQDIGKSVDRTDMGQSPAVVNAWYSPLFNSINFPAAVLNQPFFRTDQPQAVNYGFLGTVMGHELTHGFDNNGVKWDGYGGYHPEGWMTNKSMAGFRKMAECVVEEYNKFCFPEIKMCVNGKLTEGENIADNGGLMASFRAFESLAALQGREPRLPGPMSKYSAEQVFFISFGYNWCSNTTNAELITEVRQGGHSPDQTRVIETLKNIPQFRKAFGCPTGSTMAPKEHCHVWVNP